MKKLQTKERELGHKTKLGEVPLTPLLKDERQRKCPACRQTMIVLKWNKKQDIITCDNVYCTNYRQPAGNIPLGDVDAEDKSSPVSGKV